MEQGKKDPQEREEDRRQIEAFGSSLVESEGGRIYTLTIIG